MRTTVFVSTALLLAGCLAGGCKPKDKAAAEPTEITKYWNEVSSVLETVKDKQSAENAKPKLMDLAERLKKIIEANQKEKEAGTTRPEPSEAQREKLDEAIKRYKGERSRLNEVEGGRELLDEFDSKSIPKPAPSK